MRRSATGRNAAFDSEQLDAFLRSVTINLSGSASWNVFIFTRTQRKKPSISQMNPTLHMLVNILFTYRTGFRLKKMICEDSNFTSRYIKTYKSTALTSMKFKSPISQSIKRNLEFFVTIWGLEFVPSKYNYFAEWRHALPILILNKKLSVLNNNQYRWIDICQVTVRSSATHNHEAGHHAISPSLVCFTVQELT
jgi:hypothetical protein